MSAGQQSREFLFHCFPSKFGALSGAHRAGDLLTARRYHACGIAILESIIQHGMLLTPETIKIPRPPDAEQRAQPPIEVSQTRASFTLSTLDALQTPNPYSPQGHSHFDMFGEFSIGLEPLASRDFDMASVSYYYDASRESKGRGDPRAYSLIASLVHSLTEVRELLSVLALLERRSAVARGENTTEDDKVAAQFEKARVRLLNQPEPRAARIAQLIPELAPDEIHRVLAALDTDRRPFWNLVEAIDLISGLLQSADSASLGTELLYFAQREWRLVKVLNDTVLGYDLVAGGADEPANLASIRWEQLHSVGRIAELMGTGLDEEWLSRCWVALASKRSGRFFRDYIRIVTCPRSCLPVVQGMVKWYSRFCTTRPEIVPI